jgi:hypothetical protein
MRFRNETGKWNYNPGRERETYFHTWEKPTSVKGHCSLYTSDSAASISGLPGVAPWLLPRRYQRPFSVLRQGVVDGDGQGLARIKE